MQRGLVGSEMCIRDRYIKEYFCNNIHLKHMNVKNPLGKHGEVAKCFGKLARDVWMNPDPVAYPTEFRNQIGTFKPEFKDDTQQDTHEFLLFLIDCLHEDTNLITDRIIAPDLDSRNKNIEELAMESWSIFLSRNWSFVGFMFMGQLSSCLRCKECQRSSLTFDPILNISLPMSLTELLPLDITLIPLSLHIKNKLYQREDTETIPEANFADRPFTLSLTLNKTSTVEDLLNEIYKVQDVDIPVANRQSIFKVCFMFSLKICYVYPLHQKLSEIEEYFRRKQIYAIEVISPSSQAKLKKSNNHSPPEMAEELPKASRTIAQFSTREPINTNSELFSKPFFYTLNRVILPNQKYLWKQYGVWFCGIPMLIHLNLPYTGIQLYQQVWESLLGFLKPNSVYKDEKQCWWISSSSVKHPFVLRRVTQTGYACSKCDLRQQCLGCEIPATTESIPLNSEECVSTDWTLEAYSEDFIPNEELVQQKKMEELSNRLKKKIRYS
eukprot:TRINITY_DN5298_c0_g1_i1.p1 TRINITY_DN5298_c0_g1~~TRINITY_DN5298_c0_g1_i1.p1  ORF type:complete len:496 (+),score=55.26 TRINITY_DN5298_c0_g1_i1:118-1605(+)